MSDSDTLSFNQAAAGSAEAVDISAADYTPSTGYTRSIYIGGTGNLKVDMLDSGTVTFNSIAVGWHPIRVKKVYKTGTTATNIVAVW